MPPNLETELRRVVFKYDIWGTQLSAEDDPVKVEPMEVEVQARSVLPKCKVDFER